MPTKTKRTAKVVPMPFRKPSRVVPGTTGSGVQKTAMQRQADQQEAITVFWKEATNLVKELRRIAHFLAEEAKAKGGL